MMIFIYGDEITILTRAGNLYKGKAWLAWKERSSSVQVAQSRTSKIRIRNWTFFRGGNRTREKKKLETNKRKRETKIILPRESLPFNSSS